MPRLARVLKKASLFCGCNVCEKAQNSLKKFTWKEEKKLSQRSNDTVVKSLNEHNEQVLISTPVCSLHLVRP